jgi:hypothetical protein
MTTGEQRIVIRETPTPALVTLRAEMMLRPLAYRIHIRAIDLVLAEREGDE